jgi:predicted small lipoprotein YifL
MQAYLRTIGTIAFGITLAACGGSGPLAPTTPAAVEARVDGGAWRASFDPSAPVALLEGGPGGKLRIEGRRHIGNADQRITLTVFRFAGAGTYTLAVPEPGEGDVPGVGIYENIVDPLSPLTYMTRGDATGELVVDSLDVAKRTISGTFSFRARTPNGHEVWVDGGRFSGPYQGP